ncbi:MAG: putative Ig domain-containing protein [Anaerolineales bacterium]|nr:putative Ig domain-containing protein [Anaerolineales bacterium]
MLGDNNSGQLGDGTVTGRLAPVAVTGLATGVESISAGSNHSCAVTEAGAARCWGLNAYGQLGINPGWNPVDVVWRIAPRITTSPGTSAVVGRSYSYDVAAFGAPAPTFALVAKPAGMTINGTTGLIQWTPSAAGRAGVTVEAANGIDPPARQTYTITVQATAQAPQITSTPPTDAVAGQLYTYDANAIGAPSPVYLLLVKPPGMVIDPVSGVIQWTPGATGDFAVTVGASNGVNPAAQQPFVLTVHSAPVAPQITSTPMTTTVAGQPYTYDVNASGVPSPVYSLLVKPAGMVINGASGVIQWTPNVVGLHTVTVQATNGVTPLAKQSFKVKVTSANIFLPFVER